MNTLSYIKVSPVPKPQKRNGALIPRLKDLIITHIFWDTFTSHGDKPSHIEEAICDLCFGSPLYWRLQKFMGNDKMLGRGIHDKNHSTEELDELETLTSSSGGGQEGAIPLV